MNGSLLGIALSLSLLAPPALAAQSPWAEADQARLRLLLLPGAAGTLEGGIEIEVAPDWHTYWRNPGDSGVPPVFDFSGSENVASVAVSYPVPMRLADAGGVSLVYTDDVVLPLAIEPRDPGKPIVLRVEARFGVCSAVCIPTGASAELAPSADPDPVGTARLADFSARVPQAPEPGRFDIESAAVDGDTLTIAVRMPDSAYSDLFADPPTGWPSGQPVFTGRSGGVSFYRLSLAGRPTDADISGETFRFVAVSGTEAIEKAVEIR